MTSVDKEIKEIARALSIKLFARLIFRTLSCISIFVVPFVLWSQGVNVFVTVCVALMLAIFAYWVWKRLSCDLCKEKPCPKCGGKLCISKSADKFILVCTQCELKADMHYSPGHNLA